MFLSRFFVILWMKDISMFVPFYRYSSLWTNFNKIWKLRSYVLRGNPTLEKAITNLGKLHSSHEISTINPKCTTSLHIWYLIAFQRKRVLTGRSWKILYSFWCNPIKVMFNPITISENTLSVCHSGTTRTPVEHDVVNNRIVRASSY